MNQLLNFNTTTFDCYVEMKIYKNMILMSFPTSCYWLSKQYDDTQKFTIAKLYQILKTIPYSSKVDINNHPIFTQMWNAVPECILPYNNHWITVTKC